jgi:hypothetical protein
LNCKATQAGERFAEVKNQGIRNFFGQKRDFSGKNVSNDFPAAMKPIRLLLATALAGLAPASAQYSHYPDYQPDLGGGYDTGGFHSGGSSWTALAAAEWTSRYLRQGRKQFGSAGVFGFMLGGGYGPLAVDLWQGFADSNSGREFRGSLRLEQELGIFRIGLRTTYVSDTRGGDFWEMGLGASGDLFFGVKWRSEIYQGTDPSGAYADGAIFRDWQVAPAWQLSTSAGAGANFGYVRDGHRGADHLALNLELIHSLGQRSKLHGGVGHYFPVDRSFPRRAGDGDLYDGWLFNLGARWTY